MTLLITAVSPEYVLSSSDTRTTIKRSNNYIPFDEHFNKHIVFSSGGLTANITYSGPAQWSSRGKVIKIYDVISDSLAKSVKRNLAFAPLSLELIKDLLSNRIPNQARKESVEFELHVAGIDRQLPMPWVSVISTLRKTAPWHIPGELKWEYHFPGINIFLLAAERPDVIFGGMDTLLSTIDKQRFIDAMQTGMNAFNAANLASHLTELAAKKSPSVGPRSVSTLLPFEGYIDTNLWDKKSTGTIGYMPRMVFQNGTTWGPSEFPVDLNLISNAHLPKQSLFFKSIIYKGVKRSFRRRIFRYKKGKQIPGLMGMIGLILFGKTAEGYTDFGLGDEADT